MDDKQLEAIDREVILRGRGEQVVRLKAENERLRAELANRTDQWRAANTKAAHFERLADSQQRLNADLVADRERLRAKADRLRSTAGPIYRWAHEEHAHARLGDDLHDPDCLLCEQIDALYRALNE